MIHDSQNGDKYKCWEKRVRNTMLPGGSFDISTQSSSVENDPEIKVEARGSHARKEYALAEEGAPFHAFTRHYLRVYIA